MKKVCLITTVSMLLFTAGVMADALKVGASDTMHSVLKGQLDKSVTLRLKSGGELTGNVSTININVVQLSGLSGREYFDAVIPLKKIEAAIIRTKK